MGFRGLGVSEFRRFSSTWGSGNVEACMTRNCIPNFTVRITINMSLYTLFSSLSAWLSYYGPEILAFSARGLGREGFSA